MRNSVRKQGEDKRESKIDALIVLTAGLFTLFRWALMLLCFARISSLGSSVVLLIAAAELEARRRQARKNEMIR